MSPFGDAGLELDGIERRKSSGLFPEPAVGMLLLSIEALQPLRTDVAPSECGQGAPCPCAAVSPVDICTSVWSAIP